MTTGTYTIREATTAEHHKAITEMHVNLFNGGLAEVPDLNIGHWWLMYSVDTSVAFCGLYPSSYYSNTGYLCRGGVAEEHQGQGLQKRLIRVRLAKARLLGWKWAVSDTLAYNHPSSNSLIRCGFTLFKPSKKWATRGSLYWSRHI